MANSSQVCRRTYKISSKGVFANNLAGREVISLLAFNDLQTMQRKRKGSRRKKVVRKTTLLSTDNKSSWLWQVNILKIGAMVSFHATKNCQFFFAIRIYSDTNWASEPHCDANLFLTLVINFQQRVQLKIAFVLEKSKNATNLDVAMASKGGGRRLKNSFLL